MTTSHRLKIRYGNSKFRPDIM